MVSPSHNSLSSKLRPTAVKKWKMTMEAKLTTGLEPILTFLAMSIMSRATRAMHLAWSSQWSGSPETAMYLSPTVSTWMEEKERERRAKMWKRWEFVWGEHLWAGPNCQLTQIVKNFGRVGHAKFADGKGVIKFNLIASHWHKSVGN